MQANRHRSDAHPEALADPMAGERCRGGHDEAGQVGKQLNDDSSRRDHATIMPQVGERPRDGVGSSRMHNICGSLRLAAALPGLVQTPDRRPTQKGQTGVNR
jgi:hypothetical protein